MTAELALTLAVFATPLAAPLIGLARHLPNLREAVTLVTAIGLLACVISIVQAVQAGAPPVLHLVQILPGMNVAFAPEPLGALFALVAATLWIPTAVYAIGYMRDHHVPHQTRFFACFPLALASTMGIAFAGNLLTLFIFYELLTLSTYPLVAHAGSEAARRGARTYLFLLMGTSIGFLLPAIIWTAMAAGTLDFRPGGILAGRLSPLQTALLYALFLFGIGKAALMPFHRWLPGAMVAPTPVSALLHAVAVVKAGVFTVLKVTHSIFGVDVLQTTGAGMPMAFLAAFTLVAASLIALAQDNLKARLAYSTVSQLAYIVLGAAMASTTGLLGGALHIVMHAFGKITLFFCAGAILIRAHKSRVSELDGLGRRMPLTFAAFAIAAISVAGLPPGGGMWSKWLLAGATTQNHQPWLLAALLLSTLLNLAYLMPVVGRAFFKPLPAETPAHVREAPLACLIPLCLTALATLVLFFGAGPILDFLSPWAETHES
ncbi:MAG: NADH dehydrogenase subunit L [Pseudomonadota bacterium]